MRRGGGGEGRRGKGKRDKARGENGGGEVALGAWGSRLRVGRYGELVFVVVVEGDAVVGESFLEGG